MIPSIVRAIISVATAWLMACAQRGLQPDAVNLSLAAFEAVTHPACHESLATWAIIYPMLTNNDERGLLVPDHSCTAWNYARRPCKLQSLPRSSSVSGLPSSFAQGSDFSSLVPPFGTLHSPVNGAEGPILAAVLSETSADLDFLASVSATLCTKLLIGNADYSCR